MERRRVTIFVDGKPIGFYSDDTDDYISDLERRANMVMKRVKGFSGLSDETNALLAVIILSDELLRLEQLVKMMELSRGEQEMGSLTESNAQVGREDQDYQSESDRGARRDREDQTDVSARRETKARAKYKPKHEQDSRKGRAKQHTGKPNEINEKFKQGIAAGKEGDLTRYITEKMLRSSSDYNQISIWEVMEDE